MRASVGVGLRRSKTGSDVRVEHATESGESAKQKRHSGSRIVSGQHCVARIFRGGSLESDSRAGGKRGNGSSHLGCRQALMDVLDLPAMTKKKPKPLIEILVEDHSELFPQQFCECHDLLPGICPTRWMRPEGKA